MESKIGRYHILRLLSLPPHSECLQWWTSELFLFRGRIITLLVEKFYPWQASNIMILWLNSQFGRYHILHLLSLSPHSEWLQWRNDVGAVTAAIEEERDKFSENNIEKEITWLTGEYMRLKQIELSRKSVWIVAISFSSPVSFFGDVGFKVFHPLVLL